MAEKISVILFVLLVISHESTGNVNENLNGMQAQKEANKKDLLSSGLVNDIHLHQRKQNSQGDLLSISDMDALRLLRVSDNALFHNIEERSRKVNENVDSEIINKDFVNVAERFDHDKRGMKNWERIQKTSAKREEMLHPWMRRGRTWVAHKNKRLISKNDKIIASSVNTASSLVKKTDKSDSKKINSISTEKEEGSSWTKLDNSENENSIEDLLSQKRKDFDNDKRRWETFKRVVRPWLIQKGKRGLNNNDKVYISNQRSDNRRNSNVKKDTVTDQEKRENKIGSVANDFVTWLNENREQINNKLGNQLRAINHGNDDNANYNDDNVHESMSSLLEKTNMEDDSTNGKVNRACMEQYANRDNKAEDFSTDRKIVDDLTKKTVST